MTRWIKLTGISLVLALVFSCSTRDEFLQEENEDLQLKSAQVEKTTGNRYIVIFRDDVSDPKGMADEMAKRYGVQKGHVYDKVFKGFSAMIPGQALEGLRRNPNITLIEPDLVMATSGQTVPTGIARFAANLNSVVPIDGILDAPDVDVAVVDTGVDKEHPDLNVFGGVRFYNSGATDLNYDDDHGHGSHVAGTIGAKDNDFGVVGVCPGAKIWAVKVLDISGTGYTSDIVAGLNWVINQGTIEVINMSLGGTGVSSSYRLAVQSCVTSGIVVVVAAGNSSVDVFGNDLIYGTVDDYIPASYPEAMTISALADSDGKPGGVGASTYYGPDDSWATFSNFSKNVAPGNMVTSAGKAIDLILPGVGILSCYKDGNYAIMSGTSMASPHAAGLVALYIVKNGRAKSAEEVTAIRQALIDGGKLQADITYGLKTRNDPDGNEENLGWAALTGGTPLPPSGNQSPVADFSFTVSGMTVTVTNKSTDSDGSIVSWAWTFGDGSTSSLENPSHTYVEGGAFSVELTVTDDKGATGSALKSVTVVAPINTPPKADFTYSITDLSVAFADASIDNDGSIVAWTWSFGDGSTSTDQNPTHKYTKEGTYSVGLGITDDDGAFVGTSKSVIVTGTINKTPTANFIYSTNDLTVAFKDASIDNDGSIVSWAWTFGDGGNSSAQNPSHTYASAGTYTVGLTVTDDDGATAAATQSIKVTETPVTLPIELDYTFVRNKNLMKVTLAWTGGISPYTVKRDGTTIATVSGMTYTNNLTKKGTYTYQVFDDAGKFTNIVTVVFL